PPGADPLVSLDRRDPSDRHDRTSDSAHAVASGLAAEIRPVVRPSISRYNSSPLHSTVASGSLRAEWKGLQVRKREYGRPLAHSAHLELPVGKAFPAAS